MLTKVSKIHPGLHVFNAKLIVEYDKDKPTKNEEEDGTDDNGKEEDADNAI